MVRDFVNIHDVVEANLIVLKNQKADYESFNVGGGKAISIKNFCKEVAKVYNHNPENLIFRACTDLVIQEMRAQILKNLRILDGAQNDISFSIKSYREYLQNADIDKDYLDAANEKMKKLNVVRTTK